MPPLLALLLLSAPPAAPPPLPGGWAGWSDLAKLVGGALLAYFFGWLTWRRAERVRLREKAAAEAEKKAAEAKAEAAAQQREDKATLTERLKHETDMANLTDAVEVISDIQTLAKEVNATVLQLIKRVDGHDAQLTEIRAGLERINDKAFALAQRLPHA